MNILAQMEIYKYHLEHPKLSQWQIALEMRMHKYTVWMAYRAMSQQVI